MVGVRAHETPSAYPRSQRAVPPIPNVSPFRKVLQPQQGLRNVFTSHATTASNPKTSHVVTFVRLPRSERAKPNFRLSRRTQLLIGLRLRYSHTLRHTVTIRM